MEFLQFVGPIVIWVAGIVVLVRLFQKEGLMKGLLGLICMLYTFIWGWQRVKDTELNLKPWMYAWTGAIVVGLIISFIGSSGG